jgi:hypothetical protein
MRECLVIQRIHDDTYTFAEPPELVHKCQDCVKVSGELDQDC